MSLACVGGGGLEGFCLCYVSSGSLYILPMLCMLTGLLAALSEASPLFTCKFARPCLGLTILRSICTDEEMRLQRQIGIYLDKNIRELPYLCIP